MRRNSFWFMLTTLFCLTMTSLLQAADKTGVQVESWGKTPDGQEVYLYSFSNKNGLRAKMTNYGAIVVSLETPDRNGKLTNITAGFDEYLPMCIHAYLLTHVIEFQHSWLLR